MIFIVKIKEKYYAKKLTLSGWKYLVISMYNDDFLDFRKVESYEISPDCKVANAYSMRDFACVYGDDLDDILFSVDRYKKQVKERKQKIQKIYV